jgi:hypothetical protein
MRLFELFYQDPFHQLIYHLNCCYIKRQAIRGQILDIVLNYHRLVLTLVLLFFLYYDEQY